MEALDWLSKRWEEPFGDRRQEVVLIGVHLDEAYTRSLLDNCLLTDTEMEQGPEAWAKWEDPFPSWVVEPQEVSG
jgi:hypothetical protein